MSHPSTIFPSIKYSDAKSAIDWLCAAFGFEQRLVVPGEGDLIAHAQLTYGQVMIMLGSSAQGDLDKYMKCPGDLRGINTQSAYIVIEEIDKHYARAKEHGAKIILDIKDEAYGSRGYTCQDPQRVIWNFGTYNPWL